MSKFKRVINDPSQSLFFEPEAPVTTTKAEILFDGGCSPNPGKGYGSFQITLDDEKLPIERLTFGDHETNNTAEYKSLIAALQHLWNLATPSKTALTVRGDSAIVMFQVRIRAEGRPYRPDPKKAAHLEPLKAELAGLLADYGKIESAWHGRLNSVAVLGH